MSGSWEAVATCTGEWTDRGPAHLRQQTENGSSGRARRVAGGWRLQGTCTGEQVDSWTAPARQQTENRTSRSAHGGLAGHLHWGVGGLRTCTLEKAD